MKDSKKFFYKEVQMVKNAAGKVTKQVIDFHNKQDYDAYIKE